MTSLPTREEIAMMLLEDERKLLLCCVCQKMMQAPVQLSCLHNACKECFHPTGFQGPVISVTCPLCGKATQTTEAVNNPFATDYIDSLLVLRGPCWCDICRSEKIEQKAEFSCTQCRKYLCSNCLKWHTKMAPNHGVASLDDSTNWDNCLPMTMALCDTHARALELFCFNCDLPQCCDCAALCFDARHTVESMTCKKAEACMQDIRQSVWSLNSGLDIKDATVSRCVTATADDTKKLRAAGLGNLRQNKRVVLKSIEKVNDEAEEVLHAKCDDANYNVRHIIASTEGLRETVESALYYSRNLACSADPISQLQHYKHVSVYLRELLICVDEMQAKQDAVLRTTVEGKFPGHFGKVVRGWIGMPGQASTSHVDADVDMIHNEIHCDGDGVLGDSSVEAHSRLPEAGDGHSGILGVRSRGFTVGSAADGDAAGVSPNDGCPPPPPAEFGELKRPAGDAGGGRPVPSETWSDEMWSDAQRRGDAFWQKFMEFNSNMRCGMSTGMRMMRRWPVAKEMISHLSEQTGDTAGVAPDVGQPH